MDTVLYKLLAGARRRTDEWRVADAAPPGEGENALAARRWQDWRHIAQSFCRVETRFRRAPRGSGAETRFPMLFERAAFATHCCGAIFGAV